MVGICEYPLEERPREKLLKSGAVSLSNVELIAILLRTGIKGNSAIDLAISMLSHFGSLRAIQKASSSEILNIKGLGEAKACSLIASMEMAKRILTEELKDRADISHPEDIISLLKYNLRDLDHEIFWVLFLTIKNSLIEIKEMFRGGISTASVYPREIIKEALKIGSAGIIIAHNHPSGDTTPSRDDIVITKRIKNACLLFDISLIDHIIIGSNSFLSFAREGFLKENSSL